MSSLLSAKLLLSLVVYTTAVTASSEQLTNHSPWGHHSIKTEPNFTPPLIEVSIPGSPAPGHILFAQFGRQATQQAAMIMTQSGQLLWQSKPNATLPVSNLTPAKLHGQDVLMYWEASSVAESAIPVNSHGQIIILDDSYRTIHNVTLRDSNLSTFGLYNSLIDPHEVFMTSSGTLLVIAYDSLPWDLTAVGGPREGWIRDGIVYEIEVATNEILFRWRASDYISITESHLPLPDARSGEGNGRSAAAPWDYLHLNSATVFEDSIVVSSRHSFHVICIERRTSRIKWTVQGDRDGDFLMTPAAEFRWQHDAHVRRSPEGRLLLSLFNNENNMSPTLGMTPPFNNSYGMILELTDDEHGRIVTGVTMFLDPNENLTSGAGGSMQNLDNGNVFLGYGTQPVMKEYHKDSTLAMSLRFGSRDSHIFPGAGSYRARKYEWKGYPDTQPRIATCQRIDGTVDVWMSWNGATEVHSWNVYVGESRTKLSLAAGEVARDGFETTVNVRGGAMYQVEALGGCRNGTETRRSEMVYVKELCAV